VVTNSQSATSDWASRLAAASGVLKAASQLAGHPPEDPFQVRRDLRNITEKLKELKLETLLPPPEWMQRVEIECTRLKAEFWNQLAGACTQRGWELHGTTNRRLINQSLFIEAVDEGVNIETLPPLTTFHVPTVLQQLDPLINSFAASRQEPRQFVEVLQRALDSLGGGERSLEEVYRGVVVQSQKPAFWKTVNPQQFVRITRPQFRALLAQVLQTGQRTPDGRELRFGTTVQAKEAWEVYSPGEGRVVQVGRLNLL
jgi:hypothetical protein